MEALLSQGLRPSVLINNAGAAWTGDLLEMPLERWDWLMQLNLTSVFQVCAAVVPAMRPAGGLVINVSSHAARNAFPGWGAYCTVKAALASFTCCLAEEERSHGIRLHAHLGAVDTSRGIHPRSTVISTGVRCCPSTRPLKHFFILLNNLPHRSLKTSLSCQPPAPFEL